MYLCTLEPVDTFFFGGEITFGDDGANYYAQSNRMPQQTSLLGMLRYLLLMKIKPKGEDRKEVIGKESFIANKNFADGFGFIKGLSPVFLKTKEQNFFPAPLFLNDKQQPISLSESEATQVITSASDWQSGWSTSAYLAKEGLSDDHFITSRKQVCPADDLFASVTKVGITKDRNGSSDEKGFYKQQLFKLKQVQFAFLVHFEISSVSTFDPISLDQSLVTIGGEQASFILRISAYSSSAGCDEAFRALAAEAYQPLNPPDTLEKIVLTSDACVTTDIYQHCRFAITQTADFRNVVTPENTYENDDFASMSRKDDNQRSSGRYKSVKFNLLRRGSVLYPKENSAAAITTQLKAQATFYQIGYNYFIQLSNS